MLGWLGVLLVGEQAALAQCPDRIPMADVAASLGRVDAAWTALDSLALSGAVAELRARTECIDEALKPSQVASIMRAFAMADFVDKNKEGALLYFAAVRAANPGYVLPESLAGPNHPIRTAFNNASAVPTETTTLPTGATGETGVTTGTGTSSSGPPTGRTEQLPDDWRGTGFTVIMNSLSKAEHGQEEARSFGQALTCKAGVLDSSNYPALTPGYWTVFCGTYATRDAAIAAAASQRKAGQPDAYARKVA